MSSLAAARADNFYYPRDFDPDKHGSLNKYHGTHALRERAARISEGILVIRFEVPFHIWCSKCGEKIAKGRRFNADKKAIGQYHSTKIWQFSMRHHCGCIITIQTDPKNAEYLVVEGAKKKVEDSHTAEEEGVLELLDDTEKERLALDPLYRLEKGEVSKKRARTAAEDVAALIEDADAKHADAYATNARLRAKLRVVRKQDEALDAQRKALRLPDEIRLLPHAEDDAHTAALAFYAHDASGGTAAQQQVARRQAILTEPIFAPAALAGSGRQQREPPAAPRAGRASASAATAAGGVPDRSVSSRERQGGEDGEHVARGAEHKHGARRPAQQPRQQPHQQQEEQRTSAWSDSESSGGEDEQQVATQPRQAALQPGSAGGAEVTAAVPATAAAAQKRGAGLAAAHQSARAAVAAWQAGRSAALGPSAAPSKGAPAAAPRGASRAPRQAAGATQHGQRHGAAKPGHHQRGPAAAATLEKAKQLALARRAGGVGFASVLQPRE